jgi:hypothetical protein
MTFADKVIGFNKSLSYKGPLPKGIHVMNPFKENKHALETSSAFYKKFYNDTKTRKIILGINPGRFGAGVTGVPFTDTKRLKEKCRLEIPELSTHEPSSVFVYEVIDAYGGVERFYQDFYINSICPLGFVVRNDQGKEKNYNYYDSKELQRDVTHFIVDTLKQQLTFGIDTRICYCMGHGKNFRFLSKLNDEMHFFNEIIPLEHPRYIVQYKARQKKKYTDKYMQMLTS